ncbi:unnamed protein product [Closterium sp. Naga37s-1]|nr:unnamed protein product [Closterium sp. Naga37s-1]
MAASPLLPILHRLCLHPVIASPFLLSVASPSLPAVASGGCSSVSAGFCTTAHCFLRHVVSAWRCPARCTNVSCSLDPFCTPAWCA